MRQELAYDDDSGVPRSGNHGYVGVDKTKCLIFRIQRFLLMTVLYNEKCVQCWYLSTDAAKIDAITSEPKYISMKAVARCYKIVGHLYTNNDIFDETINN